MKGARDEGEEEEKMSSVGTYERKFLFNRHFERRLSEICN